MASLNLTRPHATKIDAIKLNVDQNQVRFGDRVHVFNRRWEGAALELLLDAAKSGAQVTQADFQTHVLRLGQMKPLTRAQLLRIVDNLKQFCLQNEVLGLQLHHAPRQASTGPWSVVLGRVVEWRSKETNPKLAEAKTLSWPYPLLLKSSSPQALARFLQDLVVCEGFAIYGQNLEALEMLPSLDARRLTPECVGLIQLRHIELLRRSGQLEKAKSLASALAHAPSQFPAKTALEPRIATHAAFALQRIEYDDDPIAAWPALIDCPAPPKLLMPDPFTMGEWHNLRGIALRRAIIGLTHDSKGNRQQNGGKEALDTLFEQMMLHFESALYMAISHQRWDRLHAYLDNISLCLQELLPFGLCKIEDVVVCYIQALASADKLNSGNDDAWDMIFFGKFWLDHESDLKRLASTDFHNGALTESAFRPDQKQYWVRLLERIKQGAAPRQLGIALILFGRWATQNRDIQQRDFCQKELDELFAVNPQLRYKLSTEGYVVSLPDRSRAAGTAHSNGGASDTSGTRRH